VNRLEENRPNFCKAADGKPHFSPPYGRYTVTLNELKAALKVSAQTGKSGAVNKTSVESMAQDDDFREVKRRKRETSNDTSHTTKKSLKLVPTSAAVKLPPKAVLTRDFFALLRTTDIDTKTTGADNTLPKQEASRKSGRPPPIVMTSTKNLIRLQSDLKEHVKRDKSSEIHQINLYHNKRNGGQFSPIKAEVYRAQNGLTQCYSYNCQNFGHVWANCKQPPRCLLCGGGYLHREFPEKTNTESTPSCCKCTPVGKNLHPVPYRSCSHAKELKRRRALSVARGSAGRTFFSKFTS
jgi:hypothetical protein